MNPRPKPKYQMVNNARTMGVITSDAAYIAAARGPGYPARVSRRCSRPISLGDFGTKVATVFATRSGASVNDTVPGPNVSPMVVARLRNRLRPGDVRARMMDAVMPATTATPRRSEEHTPELQSRLQLVCGLLLEKKKNSS